MDVITGKIAGCKFVDSGDEQGVATFSELSSFGKITFTIIYYEPPETENHKLIKEYIGTRVSMLTTIKNDGTNTTAEFFKLIDVINACLYNSRPITVYPRLTQLDIAAFGVNCFITSPISFEDKELFVAGQDLTLEWVSEELIESLPKVINQYDEQVLTDEAGQTLVTEDNILIEEEL